MNSEEIILTEEQLDVINLHEGHHLVLAPPGTGKTEILAQRVEKAIAKGIESDNIICLTFTNRAAKVMKDRIEEKHPNIDVFIGNIHHYCSTFLHINNLLPKYTSLMDEEDSHLLMLEAKEILNNRNEIYTPDLFKLNAYRKQKENKFPENLLLPPPANFCNAPDLELICLKYEELKTESALLDFDDLLTYAYIELQKKIPEYLMQEYSWIQVDEVQDLNPIQWALIELLSKPTNTHKVFFGDYEQAIFSFIGARLENLHNIEHQCKIHNLQKNFRSPSYLLSIYIDFAKKHLNPKWKKDPIPNLNISPIENDLLLCRVSGTSRDEAIFITKNILPFYLQKKDNGQSAILVRTNNTADTFGSVLSQHGIEHFKISGFDLFRRRIIKDLMAFFGCLTNNMDRVSWYRLFQIFSPLKTLKESRHFVNEMFSIGIFPVDFLRNNPFSLYLQNFIERLKSSRFVVFDTETTGLNVEEDDIIQIAAIEIVNGKRLNTFNVYIKTDKSLNSSINVHNITSEFLFSNGVSRKEGLESFIKFVNDATIVAHNLEFDVAILQSNLQRENIPFDLNKIEKYDTLQLSRRLKPRLYSYKLKEMLLQLNIQGTNSHNAIDDVDATSNLLLKLADAAQYLLHAQNEFVTANKKIIKVFSENLTSYWNKMQITLDSEVAFNDMAEDFFDNLKILVDYKFEDEDHIHLDKLTKHMKLHGKKNFKSLLRSHIPDYLRYKESDLLIGDELVVVSTVHKAKGLEFQNVIVPECVDNIYPNYYSTTPELKNEDARTLYVALSRSKCRLAITYHTVFVSIKGNRFTRNRSPFLLSIEKHFKSITN